MPADRDLRERLADEISDAIDSTRSGYYQDVATTEAAQLAAERVLAVLSTEYVPANGDYCEHGIGCPGTGPDCARAGTLQEARQRAWDEALTYIRVTEAEHDLALAALREAGQYEQVGGVEWCPVHAGLYDEINEDHAGACDQADSITADCERVPLYRKSTEASGDEPGPVTRCAGRSAVAHPPTLMVAGRCPVCGEAVGQG